MNIRICDNCGREIEDGDRWVLLEYRDKIDANNPSIATAEVCDECGRKLIPMHKWR